MTFVTFLTKYLCQKLKDGNGKFLQCTISVYEKEDGKAYVSLINSGALATGLPDNIGKVMKAASDETFEIVKSVADKTQSLNHFFRML